MAYPFKNNLTQKKLTQSKKKKKKPPKLKLTHPTQIKNTLKLNYNSLPLYNKPLYSIISLAFASSLSPLPFSSRLTRS
jgi:hypothetical protein